MKLCNSENKLTLKGLRVEKVVDANKDIPMVQNGVFLKQLVSNY